MYMNEKQTLTIISKIFKMIFNQEISFNIDEFISKFAFDIKLPRKVLDSTTGEETWSVIMNSTKFITQSNTEIYDKEQGWMLGKQEVHNLQDIISIWKKTNFTTTERQYDCINVSQCDPIYTSENAFRCTDCHDSKNIAFCDGCISCEYCSCCQRSANCGFCFRVDDSGNCTNSYNVTCSKNISNSLFIQDCSNLHECIFCSHISHKKFCIANMQFSEKEYFAIKKHIINWILESC